MSRPGDRRRAPHGHIDALERGRLSPGDSGVEDLAGQQDHPGAGPVGGHALGETRAKRLEQLELAKQMRHRGGLPAGDHQGVECLKLGKPPHGVRLGAGFAQRGQMFAGVALKCEHTDHRERRHVTSLGRRTSGQRAACRR